MKFTIPETIAIPGLAGGRGYGGRLPLAVLALALALTWGHGSASTSLAAATSPDFNMGVSAGAFVKDGCDTAGGDHECNVHPGGDFTIVVRVDKLGPLPDDDGDTKAGYNGFEVDVRWTPGLVWRDRSGTDELGPSGSRYWPDCAFPAEAPVTSERYLAGCGIGVGANESLYTGKMIEIDFTCPPTAGEHAITLVHGDLQTNLGDEDGPPGATEGDAHNGEVKVETLAISCAFDFPWDVDGNGVVRIPDIVEVVQHFGEDAPAP